MLKLVYELRTQAACALNYYAILPYIIINCIAGYVELLWYYLYLTLVIQLIMVLFSDYLKENITQQHMVSPEPASLREKGKSWRKKDQTHACPKVRKARPVSYDRTGMWYHWTRLLRNHYTFSNYSVVCLLILDTDFRKKQYYLILCVWLLKGLLKCFLSSFWKSKILHWIIDRDCLITVLN